MLKKITFVVILFFLGHYFTFAQCSMCRAVLESEEGGGKAEAINDGIVWLMAFPYILVGLVFYAVYKMKFSKKIDAST